jgi:hypothetical protein
VLTTLGLGGLLVACIAAVGAPAQAQTAACRITVADVTPPAGSIQMVIGDHFPTTPHTVPIRVSGGEQVGLATIDDNGHFADPVRLPSDLPTGLRTITVECGLSGAPAVSEISVVRASAAAPGQKANDDHVDGAALVVAGVLAVVAALALTARRRRTQRVAV